MESWVVKILEPLGLAGAVIAGLVGVVIWQSRAIAAKDAELKVLNDQRAAEREKLMELFAGATNAQRITAEVTARRNEIMEDLAGAMTTQANSNDRMGDKVVSQAEMFKERLGDFKHVIDSFGESNRVMTGLVAEVRNILVGMGVKIDAIPNAIHNAVANAQGRAP